MDRPGLHGEKPRERRPLGERVDVGGRSPGAPALQGRYFTHCLGQGLRVAWGLCRILLFVLCSYSLLELCQCCQLGPCTNSLNSALPGLRVRPGRWGHPCDCSVAGRVGGPKRTPDRWVHLRALSHDLPCPQRACRHPRPCSQLLVEEAHGRVAAPHQLLGTTEKLLNGIGPQSRAV